MKRLVWISTAVLLLTLAVWAAVELATAPPDPAKFFPDGALLYIQANDFQALLNDWNSSSEKRAWLKGDNYAAFSRSRLFDRLSQAQGEFSTAATIPTDENLLTSVAGQQSALALYDIGNLEFVYVTHMDQAKIEATPLWRVRDKFEQRTEGKTQFYIRQDVQSNRSAAFAARDGWLVLGTRADLVAAVLDRLQGAQAHGLTEESWYADALKHATGSAPDLRMAINLEKVVPSPHFRSYWVQRNITELKQYRAALCDLHRTKQDYREDRVLLRKPGPTVASAADVQNLMALAPDDAVFSSAVASPDANRVLAEMRENILELKTERAQTVWSAPSAPSQANAGSPADFESRIDVAPVIAAQADPFQPLRALLATAQPDALVNIYTTRSANDQMFAAIDRAIVLRSATPWNAQAVESAIPAAIRTGLTASQMGIEWIQRTAPAGNYFAIDGPVQIFLAVRNTRLFLSTSESLLQALLQRDQQPQRESSTGVTYSALFRHSPREQQNFRKIVNRLDSVNGANPNASTTDAEAEGDSNGRTPPFFSGNVASLSRTFADLVSEKIEEKDQGELVTQTVVYQWKQP